MEIRAQFRLDEAYFRENYSQWLRNFSRFRRWERHVGVVLIIAGLVTASYGAPIFLPAAMIGVGVAEFVEFYWYRRNWINQRLKVRPGSDNQTELTFGQTGVDHKGPTSSGYFSWEAVKKIDLCPGGLFLRVGDGQSIYVPESSLSPSGSAQEIVRLSKSGT